MGGAEISCVCVCVCVCSGALKKSVRSSRAFHKLLITSCSKNVKSCFL